MKRLGLTIAIASALGLTACGGGGSSSGGASGATVSGTASKGIIVGGLVSAFLFDSSGNPETTAVDTAVTDSNGDYTLNIPAIHNGKPLFIVVDDNGGAATMKCDIAGGCDNDGDGNPDAAFGEDLDLGDGDLEMSAVLPESTEEVSVNVTPLTTVAAELAKDVIAMGSVTDFNIQEAVNNANSQVAERFGLTAGDITEVPVVDLTDAEDVAAAAGDNAEAIQVAAINAAIISAVQADGAGAVSIDEAIETFADDYVTNGLTDNAVSGDITDLGEILADAGDVLDEVVTIVTEELGAEDDSLTELASVSDDVEADQTAADGTTATDTGDQGTASPTANAENLAQVKAFVEEIREIGTAIDASVVGEGEGALAIEAILDNFDLQVDAADMVTSDDAEAAMEAMGLAAEAIVGVYGDNFIDENDDLIDPVAGEYEYINDDQVVTAVTVAVNGDVTTLNVQATYEVLLDDSTTVYPATVNVTGTVNDITFNDDNYTETETQTEAGFTTTEVGTLSATLNADLAGTASSGVIDIEVLNGTVTGSISAVLDNTITDTSTGYDDSIDESFSLTSLAFDLDVTMEHDATALGEVGAVTVETETAEGTLTTTDVTIDPMTFTGGLSFSVGSWTFAEVTDEMGSFNGEFFSEDINEEITYGFGTLAFALAGTFGNSTEEFDMSISVEADGRNVPDLTEIFDTELGESELGGEETNSAFATASIDIMFNATLNGVADSMDFSFELNRTGRDDGDMSVEMSYPGRIITITAEGSDLDSEGLATASMTLINNDGVQITATGDESIAEPNDITVEIRKDTDGDGDIDSDDFLYAWYEERNGLDVLVYTDDVPGAEVDFETFF